MDIVKLTDSKLDVNEIYLQVVASSTGAASLFVGTTRDTFENKKVVQLEYEAFAPMAEKEIKKICQSIRDKWNVEHIAIYHRLGIVPVSEASVVLAISSVHRAESLEAVRFGIDALKKSVPIWKKEIYDEGSAEWKANKECQWTKGKDQRKRKALEDTEADHVQIKASNAELEMRISAFMSRKRAECDVSNIQEFCHRLPSSSDEGTESNSCARTDSILVTRKDSKSHFKVSRVVNTHGPQTHSETAPSPATSHCTPTPAILERLQNMETHLGLFKNQPVPQDVYSRLKALEERILHLESTSPEYFDGAFRLQNHKEEEEAIMKIDQRMEELRQKLHPKSN